MKILYFLITHIQNGTSWFTCTVHTWITLNEIDLGKISLGFILTIMVLPLKGSSFIDIQDSCTLLRCNDTNFTKSETKRTFDQRLIFMQITKSTLLDEGGKGLFSCNVIAVFYFTFNVFLLFYLTFSRARRVPRSTCSAYLILRASWFSKSYFACSVFFK